MSPLIVVTPAVVNAAIAAVLNALTFRSTSDNPTLNNTDLARAYSIQINDGKNNNLAGGAGDR